jgi:hypothetical protein
MESDSDGDTAAIVGQERGRVGCERGARDLAPDQPTTVVDGDDHCLHVDEGAFSRGHHMPNGALGLQRIRDVDGEPLLAGGGIQQP